MYMRQIVRSVAALGVASVLAACGRGPSAPPGITIGYSNDMDGAIRSCGCAVHDYGGLGRRATFLDAVRDTVGDFLLLDGGGFFGSNVNYGRLKADLTLESMKSMRYDAIALGEEEFGFGVDYIVERTRELALPVVECNVYDARADTLLFAPHRVVTLSSGLKVGIIGVLGDHLKLPPQVRPGRLRVSSAAAAVRRQVRALADSVDLLAVVGHLRRSEAQRIARQNGDIDLIVHGSEGRPMRRMRPFGNAWLLQLAAKGLYMGIAYAVLDGHGGIRRMEAHQYPLDGRYADAPSVAKLFRAYDLNIAAKEKYNVPVGVLEARRGLRKPFAGVDACRSCHTRITTHWATTQHAHAYATLQEKSRQYNRDCTPCHTTGFYDTGGFVSFAVTPKLVNVQCESCHGNGYDHVADPTQALPKDAAQACQSCHTPQRSPDFRFEKFWPRIEHPGPDG